MTPVSSALTWWWARFGLPYVNPNTLEPYHLPAACSQAEDLMIVEDHPDTCRRLLGRKTGVMPWSDL